MLRELTAEVPLADAAGRLNPDAVGWARHPLVDTSRIPVGWGRNKRWEYWNVLSPTHLLALTVSSIDYAAVNEVWVFDRATRRSWGKAATVLPSRGVVLPPRLGDGVADVTTASARAKGLEIDIDTSGPVTRLRARIPEASFDVTVSRPPGHECLAVVVPWSRTRFQYTVKDVALPATGTVTIEGASHGVADAWAVLDHGRGRWPYDVRWNWGAGAGVSGGRTIGIQVGGQWTDGTGSTENGVVIDGRLHKIHDELRWEYDLSNWRRPWRVRGGGLDASFTPFSDKHSATHLGVVSSRTDWCFGHWSGTFADAEAEVSFDALAGFAEDVHNRW